VGGAAGLGGDDPARELAECRGGDVGVAAVEQRCGVVVEWPGDEGAVAGEVEPDAADAVSVGGVEPGVAE
jgi:hypothetical protein